MGVQLAASLSMKVKVISFLLLLFNTHHKALICMDDVEESEEDIEDDHLEGLKDVIVGEKT